MGMPALSRISLILMAAISVLTGVSYFWNFLLSLCLLVSALLGAAILIDILITPGKNSVSVSRIIGKKLSLGDNNEVKIVVANKRMMRLKGKVTDNPPAEFQQRDTAFEFVLPGGGKISFSYTVRPLQRGEFVFGTVSLKMRGLIGFTFRIYHLPVHEKVKAYPSFLKVKNQQLLSRRNNLNMQGKKLLRYYGEGREFESLREYTPNDEYRKINWKATARRGKPIVSQFQIERNQNVMILLDCGRMMRTESQGMTKLDHAVNAALMFSWICIYKEDNVGLTVFDSKVESFLAPGRGKTQMNAINEILYKVNFRFEEPDYSGAFQFLERKLRKRSLIVLLTDIVDDRASGVLIREFTKLYPRHLPLCVTIRDESLEQVALSVPETTNDMLEMGIAQGLVDERIKAFRFLQLNGVLTLDTIPPDLTAGMINRYLEIKSKSLI